MANRLLYTNKIYADQNLVADSSELYYPPYLAKFNYAQTWRTLDSASSHNVVQSFSSAVAVDTVFLGNVNFTSLATVTIQAHTSDSWGAPSFSSTFNVSGLANNPPHRNLYKELSSTQTFRYWRVLINDTTNPNGFYEVGEWWLGERITLGVGQDFQSERQETFVRNNIKNVTEWNQKYVYPRSRNRTFSLDWRAVSSTTKDQFLALEYATSGDAYPWIFVPDGTTTPGEAFFVRLGNDIQITQVAPASKAYNIQLVLEEEAVGLSLPTT